jgi:hypothetical protein
VNARARENAAWVALAGAGAATIGWLGLGSFGWNDYVREALGAINALVHVRLGDFFALAPAYGGSLLERAPFALAPSLWGGGELAVYRMMALPCLLAGGALGLWLLARMRHDGQGRPARALVLALCVANPMTLTALEAGHPEELLGGVLCVAAVLLAARGRAVWAGVALGVAFANKQWALLALGPALLALPGRRILCASVAGAVGGALIAPFALSGPGAIEAMRGAASPGSAIFLPSQLWWFLGSQHPDGYRAAPGWVGPVSHPLIVALAVPLTLAAWLRLRRAGLSSARGADRPRAGARASIPRREADALLLLALLLALRFMLDPWDNAYYPIPFMLALVAWEALARKRLALLAGGATAAAWAGQHWMAPFTSPDAQAAFFAAWSVPLASGLALALWRRACVRVSFAPQYEPTVTTALPPQVIT